MFADKKTRKHKLSSGENESSDESDDEMRQVKCIRLDSPPRSPSPTRCNTSKTEEQSQLQSKSVDVSSNTVTPAKRLSTKGSVDDCDSDESDSDDDSVERALTPQSIRSPSPPPIMSPDHEPEAIDLRVSPKRLQHPIPEYTDGPPDQKSIHVSHTLHVQQHSVFIAEDSNLVPPDIDLHDDDVMDHTVAYENINDIEIPGVINLAKGRKGKQNTRNTDRVNSGREESNVNQEGSDHGEQQEDRGSGSHNSGAGGGPVDVPESDSNRDHQRRVFAPSLAPPTQQSVTQDIIPLGLSQVFHQEAYCGNASDVPERPR